MTSAYAKNTNNINDLTEYVDNLDINNKSNSSKKRKLNNSNISISNIKNADYSKSAIIYSRCSTAKQNMNDHQTLLIQTMQGIEYCNKKNFNIISILKDIHHGHDISKLSVNSIPDTYHNINIIIVDPSRLSRNISDANNFMLKCAKNNVKIHFVRDNLISTSNIDYKNILSSVHDAFIETQTLSKRIKASIETRKEHGSYIGKPPFGYDVCYDNNKSYIKIRKLIENVKEQKIIELINKLYDGSDINSFHKLFRELSNDKKFILKDSNNNSFTEILYGNISANSIAQLLNEYNILNRNNEWSSSSILSKIKRDDIMDI